MNPIKSHTILLLVLLTIFSGLEFANAQFINNTIPSTFKTTYLNNSGTSSNPNWAYYKTEVIQYDSSAKVEKRYIRDEIPPFNSGGSKFFETRYFNSSGKIISYLQIRRKHNWTDIIWDVNHYYAGIQPYSDTAIYWGQAKYFREAWCYDCLDITTYQHNLQGQLIRKKVKRIKPSCQKCQFIEIDSFSYGQNIVIDSFYHRNTNWTPDFTLRFIRMYKYDSLNRKVEQIEKNITNNYADTSRYYYSNSNLLDSIVNSVGRNEYFQYDSLGREKLHLVYDKRLAIDPEIKLLYKTETLYDTAIFISDLNESIVNEGIYAFPNPASDKLSFELSSAFDPRTIVEVFSLHGNSVLKTELNENARSINISALEPGVYIYKILSENVNSVGKFIKQ